MLPSFYGYMVRYNQIDEYCITKNYERVTATERER